MKVHGIFLIDKSIDHVLICEKCNYRKNEALQQALKKSIIAVLFNDTKVNYCIHTKAIEYIDPLNHFTIDAGCFP